MIIESGATPVPGRVEQPPPQAERNVVGAQPPTGGMGEQAALACALPRAYVTGMRGRPRPGIGEVVFRDTPD